MGSQYDFKKEWPKIKKELMRVSQEAVKLAKKGAKKGEKELVKISKKGKLHLHVAKLNVKKEQLYHMIGKEYVKADCPATPTLKLKKFIDDLSKIDKQLLSLNKKIRAKSGSVKAKKGKRRKKG